MTDRRPGRHGWGYETKVAACADYLIGVKTEDIERKYGVSAMTVSKWIRARKCFKLRRENVMRHARHVQSC